jgi:signal transduction histidine kinase
MVYILLALISLISFAIFVAGLLAFVRNKSDIQNRWFFFFTSGLAAWTMINYLDSNTALRSNAFVLKSDYVLALFLLWGFLNFSLVLFKSVTHRHVGYAKIERFNPVFIFGNVLMMLLLAIGSVFRIIETPAGSSIDYSTSFYSYVFLISLYFVLSIYVLLSKRQHLVGKERKSLNIIIGGLFLAFVTNILTNIMFPALNLSDGVIRALNLVGYAGIGVLALCIYVAITKQKLFDIRLVVARAATYMLSLGVLAGVYALLVLVSVSLFFNIDLPIDLLVFLALATAVLGLIFQPLRRIFDKGTTRLFYQDAYVPQHLLNRLNGTLVSTIEIQQIIQQSIRILAEEIKIDKVRIAIKQVASSSGYDLYDSSTIKVTEQDYSALQSQVSKTRKKVILYDEIDVKNVKLLELFSANDIALLAVLRPEVGESREPIGFLMLGQKRSGNPYERHDAQVLETVANELMLALQNALQFQEIQHFNVTLQKQVNEATGKLRVTNAKLRKLDETKDEFISMASHQLRTPLTSVKGYLSMVLEGDVGKLNKQQEQMLTQSYMSSQRMVYLISDLLNLSRLNTGKFLIERSPVDLTEIVQLEMDQLRETAKARDVTLAYDKPDHFPKMMLDETKTHQVVMNLLDNAIYYTRPGGTVTIELNETPTSVEYLVKDNGIGVPRSEQRHLFTKFYRAGNARAARPDGTGLGLFMAKKVIVAQGGAMIFDSVEGKGSTFGFRFNKLAHGAPVGEGKDTAVTVS